MGLGVAIAVGGSPDPDLANATLVEVTERMGETTTYRIRYDVDVSSGDFPLLTDSRVDAGSELAIIAPLSGTNNYLVKGPGHRTTNSFRAWKLRIVPRSSWRGHIDQDGPRIESRDLGRRDRQ